MPPVTVMMTVSQRSKQDRGRTEEGRKPVLFGNREKNTEALLNRKRDREKRGKLTVLVHLHCRFYNVHIWVDPNFQVKEERDELLNRQPPPQHVLPHTIAQCNPTGMATRRLTTGRDNCIRTGGNRD